MSTTKSLEELMKDATMEKDDKLNRVIDTEILPKVSDRMSHRMYNLTKHHKFNGAKALFSQAMTEVAHWFNTDEFTNKGYKLSFAGPDAHGRVTLTFSFALFKVSRMYNLAAFVSKAAIFNSTQDSLFQ